MTGRAIGRYDILERIGAGGMGTVYKARDRELARFVAVKVMTSSPGQDDERKRRFLQEARSASALNHPNIVTIHEIVHADGAELIVMEFVDGQPLSALIRAGALPVERAVGLGRQITAALGAAHRSGIIHRDIKPANILVTASGLVKVVDFGLAKATPAAVAPDEATATMAEPVTGRGTVLGTVAYMSPEQAEGKTLDPRSDVFSFGVVLYEMLSGKQPFRGDSQLSTMMAILRDPLPPLDVPAVLRQVLESATAKRREDRPADAAEVAAQLEAFERSTMAAVPAVVEVRRGIPRLAVAAAVLAAVAGGGWFWWRQARQRAAAAAIPEIARLAGKGEFFAAFDRAVSIAGALPDDAESKRVWTEAVNLLRLDSDPPGAAISIKPFGAPDSAWRPLGVTPASGVRVPRGAFLVKAEKAGSDTVYGFVLATAGEARLRLPAQGTIPAGMVMVPHERSVTNLRNSFAGSAAPLEASYFMDRHEVTNREFKEFIDAGGYQRRELWKHFSGKLPFEQLSADFRDKTARPGPATWEGGTFPAGQADYPVNGVSWFEAAAYAEFRGKQLPTVVHWFTAVDAGTAMYTAQTSNVSASGPAPVGKFASEGTFGTFDMIGNVKEWLWNDDGAGRRWVAGSAWTEPGYHAVEQETADPFDRSPLHGFRCMRVPAGRDEATLNPQPLRRLDLSNLRPVSDEAFEIIRGVYRYEKTADLAAKVESVDDSVPDWKRERVSFNAAYGNEKVPAYVFLPRSARPPYQAVLFVPGSSVMRVRTSTVLHGMEAIDFIIRSGRAVIFPVLQGFYERSSTQPATPTSMRSSTIQMTQDIMRSVDYLVSRPDIDADRIGFAGFSFGGQLGPVPLALEPRFKVAVLVIGGLVGGGFPETSRINFVPRVRQPTLFLNGRYDFTFPVETSQKPLFQLLGTPAKDKRSVLFETGHGLQAVRSEWIRETLDWLDKYLGPVPK